MNVCVCDTHACQYIGTASKLIFQSCSAPSALTFISKKNCDFDVFSWSEQLRMNLLFCVALRVLCVCTCPALYANVCVCVCLSVCVCVSDCWVMYG